MKKCEINISACMIIKRVKSMMYDEQIQQKISRHENPQIKIKGFTLTDTTIGEKLTQKKKNSSPQQTNHNSQQKFLEQYQTNNNNNSSSSSSSSIIPLISSPPLTGLAFFSNSSTKPCTVLSIPLLRDTGFAPEVTLRSPSLIISRARTEAVVVPSPAESLVLLATLIKHLQSH